MPRGMDQVSDKNGVELVRLSQLYEFPPFVKQADFTQVMSDRARPLTAYADVPRQQFPCDTAASTWLSALYYLDKKAEFHPKDQSKIEARLDRYAGFWRIKGAYDRLRDRWQELHKTAEEQLPDSAYAYVWVDEQGHKDRHLRLSNATEVKAASEYLAKHRDAFSFEQCHTMAKRILEKAASYGASLAGEGDYLEQLAGRGVCSPQEVVQQIEKRAYLTTNQGLREQFLKMAGTIKTLPRLALQPSMLVKLATTLDQLDRCLGLAGHYSEAGLERPEKVIFGTTFQKVASELAQVVATTTGTVYEKQAFKKLALADVQSLFGNEFAERVRDGLDIDPEKMAEEAAALPRPDAALLDALLGDNGIRPTVTKAASARQGLSKEEQEAWAAAYQASVAAA